MRLLRFFVLQITQYATNQAVNPKLGLFTITTAPHEGKASEDIEGGAGRLEIQALTQVSEDLEIETAAGRQGAYRRGNFLIDITQQPVEKPFGLSACLRCIAERLCGEGLTIVCRRHDNIDTQTQIQRMIAFIGYDALRHDRSA